jgi:hypothetical protein
MGRSGQMEKLYGLLYLRREVFTSEHCAAEGKK